MLWSKINHLINNSLSFLYLCSFKEPLIEIIDIILLFGGGLIGGLLAGLLGIGGGPIYVLIFSFFIPKAFVGQIAETDIVQMVIANTVFARFFAALSGCLKQYQLKNLFPKTAIAIAIPAVITSLTLINILSRINYNKTYFSIVVILIFIPLLYKMITDDKDKKQFNQPYRIKQAFLVFTGTVSGSLTALAGLGGGLVIVPLMNALFNIKIRKVVSISLNVIFINAFIVSTFYAFQFKVDADIPYLFGAIALSLAVPVVIGVMIAAPIGVKLSRTINPYYLRLLFISFCILMILKTLIVDIIMPML